MSLFDQFFKEWTVLFLTLRRFGKINFLPRFFVLTHFQSWEKFRILHGHVSKPFFFRHFLQLLKCILRKSHEFFFAKFDFGFVLIYILTRISFDFSNFFGQAFNLFHLHLWQFQTTSFKISVNMINISFRFAVH